MESSTNFDQKPYLSRTRPICDRFDHVWLGKSSWWAPELSKSKNIPGIAPAATDSHQISRVSKNIDFEGSYLRFSTGGATAAFTPQFRRSLREIFKSYTHLSRTPLF